MIRQLYSAVRTVALIACLASSALAADDIEDFYRGRTLNIVVGHEAGTGFDVYSRALARHLGRFIPGKPNVSVQNMQGASGMTSANWLYNIAPRDGSVIATWTYSVTFEPLLGDATARFDPLKFNWIGNMDESTTLCFVSKEAGLARFEDLLARETLFGGSGAGTAGPLSQTPNAVRNLTGAKIKLVQGYRGSFDIKLAIERGEVHGICGLPLTTARTEWRDMLDSGRLKPLIQLGRTRHPDLQDVPLIYDYAKTEEDRQVFDVIFGSQGLGRAYMAPPGVPDARVAALRKALMDTLADATFRQEAKAMQMDITPSSGEEVAKMLARFYATPSEALARAKRAVRGN